MSAAETNATKLGLVGRTAPSEGVLQSTKESIVAITATVSTSTGWVALDNGLIVTSWRAVAFHNEVTLTTHKGRRAQGRVVAVDAEKNLGLVLPLEPLGIKHLPLRAEPEPRLGEQVTVLIVSPNPRSNPSTGLVAYGAFVSAEKDKTSLAALEPDLGPRVGRGGSPVLDAKGQVIGLLTQRPHDSQSRWEEPRLLLPTSSFLKDLKAQSAPSSELVERAPIHRCPTCSEPFQAENDRCRACGLLLPHAFLTPPHAIAAERVIRDALSSLGVVANKVRIGPSAWRILHRALGSDGPASEVTIRVDEQGLQVILRVPLVELPTKEREHVYRMLLTANDQSAGLLRLSLAGSTVMLSLAEPTTAFASEHDIAALFHDLVRHADHYRKHFAELFDAAPLYETALV